MLYDHQTRSYWMHITGECIAGELEGTRLAKTPSGRHTTWGDWRRAHPATAVLKPQRRWQDQPGDQGYFDEASARAGLDFLPPQFVPTIQTRDPRLSPSALLYGVVVGKSKRAYPFQNLARRPVVHEDVGGTGITIWFDKAARSASAFHRKQGARTLTFRIAERGRREDVETGSLWTMDGLCIRGPLKASRLKPVFGLQAEWYGWYANHPDTTIWDG